MDLVKPEPAAAPQSNGAPKAVEPAKPATPAG
jgi:hypothetical protein